MKKIGEILIDHGAITHTQLEKALQEQKKIKDKRVGEILIDMGFVKEEDIVMALAVQFNYPYLPLANYTLNPEMFGVVPRELVEKHGFIPIDKVSGVLTVAMADPSDEEAVAEIEKATGCKVLAFVSSGSEIEKAARTHFGDSPKSQQGSDLTAARKTLKKATSQQTRN